MILVLGWAACGREPAPPQGEPDAKLPRQVIENMVLRQTSTKGLLWVLEAERAISYGPDEPVSLEQMTVRFYDGSAEVRSVLRSRRGSIDNQTTVLIAEDSVVVETPEGDRLETERLEWDPKRELVKTDRPFRLTRKEDVLTGVGIEAEPGLREYRVAREVRAVMKDRPGEEILEGVDGEGSDRP